MGYPMTYQRVVKRNQLADPEYAFSGARFPTPEQVVADIRNGMSGDLRRLERDQRDSAHLQAYADVAGITPEQVKMVLDALFIGLPTE